MLFIGRWLKDRSVLNTVKSMAITTKAELLLKLQRGKKFKYLPFWGHQKPSSGINQSCLSQWYDAEFVVDEITYLTAEHFMMAKKAELFGDEKAKLTILKTTHPGDAKKQGRHVAGFDEALWRAHRFEIVVAANLAKFSQHPELAEYLMQTGKRILVEASPVDKVWGIGLAADHPAVEQPSKWRGLNLLGFALMQVREQLLMLD